MGVNQEGHEMSRAQRILQASILLKQHLEQRWGLILPEPLRREWNRRIETWCAQAQVEEGQRR